MRILYIHHTLPPLSYSGSEIYHYNLAREMARRHDVTVLYRGADTTAPEYSLRERQADGMRLIEINNTFRECTSFELTYANPEIERRVAELIDGVNPQIVHFGHVTCLSTGLPARAKERGARVLMTLHDFWLLCQRGQLLRRDYSLCDGPSPARCTLCLADQIGLTPRAKQAAQVAGRYLNFAASPALRRLAYLYSLAHVSLSPHSRAAVATRAQAISALFTSVDLFISPSIFLREFFIHHGIEPGRIIQSANGLDKSFLATYRRIPSETLRLGYIGSLMPSKGVDVLLRAMRMLGDANVSLSIHGAFQTYHGDATFEPRVRPLLDHPRVQYRGPFQHEELGSILSKIDALIVPSVWYENAPVTIQEAQEAGIPVIASDLGGMREAVRHGVDGLLFEAGSCSDLARSIRSLAIDRTLLSRLAAGARPLKSIAENASELDGIYTGLLQK